MQDYLEPYQWDIRPKEPTRPAWFRNWPDGCQIALQVIVLHEWETVPWHRSRPFPANAHYKFDYLALGTREYGFRHGIQRLLDVLDAHRVRATVVTNGIVADLFPAPVKAVRERGHEIACHQYDQAVFPPTFRSREEEKASLVRALAALERVSGTPIRGYMSPGPRPTNHTMSILAELGLDWTCDYLDSDIPYFIEVGGKKIVSISYATPGCLDYDLLAFPQVQRLEHMKYTFDAAYEESKRHPMKFCYAVHTHWGGTVPMGRMLSDFLHHVRRFPGVWFSTYGDVASFWRKGAGQG